MQMLMIIMLTISISILFLNHPLTLGLMLMLMMILVTMMTGMFASKFWYSYVLFLIMIGGMMVLFLYMTSIASNIKFKFSWKILTLMTFSMVGINSLNFKDKMLSPMMTINIDLTMSKFFNPPTNIIMLLMMLYLLISLIVVVKITKINFGPLRKI